MSSGGEGLSSMNCRHNLTALQNHDSAVAFRSERIMILIFETLYYVSE